MSVRIKGVLPTAAWMILAGTLGLSPTLGFANPMNLFEPLSPNESWELGIMMFPKTAVFNQTASGGTDAVVIAKTTLSYFISTDCSGAALGSYTTNNTDPFPISINTPFGLTTEAAWNAGLLASIQPDDMLTVQSIAMTLRSTINNTPQANFTGSSGGTNPSFVCIPASCSSGECTSTSFPTQNFTLKTTAAVGDPADGGVIGCLGTGSPSNLFYLVVPANNNSAGMQWSSNTTLQTNAIDDTDGATNTTKITQTLNIGVSAAGLCQAYSTTGGYTTDWFLPAKNQLNCLYTNRNFIGGPVYADYWSSTESSATAAWVNQFSLDTQTPISKSAIFGWVRCARAFNP